MEIPSTNCGTCPAQEDIIIMEIPGTARRPGVKMAVLTRDIDGD
jgi:hypothetical protein